MFVPLNVICIQTQRLLLDWKWNSTTDKFISVLYSHRSRINRILKITCLGKMLRLSLCRQINSAVRLWRRSPPSHFSLSIDRLAPRKTFLDSFASRPEKKIKPPRTNVAAAAAAQSDARLLPSRSTSPGVLEITTTVFVFSPPPASSPRPSYSLPRR